MNTKKTVLLVLSITALLLLNLGWINASAYSTNSQIQSSTLFVKPAVNGLTCTSWADPCELQAALNIAKEGDEIWVVEGTYNPTVPAGREATFQLESGVAIYGGFIGTETSREQRDWVTNITTLSGDIGTEGVIEDNSYNVVTGSGVDDTAVLDGFTITAGNANDDAATSKFAKGGGIYNDSGSPTLTNVAFTSNFAKSGGGMYNYLGNPTLTNVSFVGNNANFGGGIYNSRSNPILSNVTFTDNSSHGDGGGMYNIQSNPSLSFVEFSLNNAAVWGGGMYNQSSDLVMLEVDFYANDANYGGGMSNAHSNPVLDYVTFKLNTAIVGGGMLNTGTSNASVSNTTFSENYASDVGGGMRNSGSDPSLVNVIFSGNIAENSGGGMLNVSDSNPILNDVLLSGNTVEGEFGTGGGMDNIESSPTLTNVTFSGNSSTDSGGGIYNNRSNLTLTNATFTGNTAAYGGGIFNHGQIGEPAHLTITNSILWGNTPDQIFNMGAENIETITYSLLDYPSYSGPSNILDDPLLGPLADNGGFTFTHALGAGSSAIDAGDPSNCPVTDQRGFPRPVDGDGIDGPGCDMGAYEVEQIIIEPEFSLFLPLILK